MNLEPNKCSGWYWVDIETLPKKIFIPLQNFKKSEFKEKLVEELLNSNK